MSASKERILIIDDDPFVREFTETLINRERPETIVDGYGSAADGLEAARTHKPDLILLDLTMPEMDGYEAAPLLRKIVGAKVPIIILTGDGINDHDSLLESIGVNGVISKPFAPVSFISQLQQYQQRGALKKDGDEFEKKFSEISASYENHLATALKSLTQIRSSLGTSDDVAGVVLDLRDIAHQLAGSAGLFHFSAIGDAANDLEGAVLEIQKKEYRVEEIFQVSRALDELIGRLTEAL